MTRRFSALVCIVFLTLGASPGSRLSADEAAFLKIPSADGARETSMFINEQMHYPGTPGDHRLALYMRDRMRELGLKAQVESFQVTVYTPKTLQLQLLSKPAVTFDLHEGRIASDPDGSRPDAGIPFNAGSGNGDVRAPLVYVSRGLEADYGTVQRAGVDVRGKIALVRYGAEFRGNLAKRAQDHGAAGVIFYSDPAEDGFKRGGVYPGGRFRPAESVQRGTVAFNDKELAIPILPVTSITARRLLADMTGVAGPATWAGGLPVPYVIGTSRSPVHLHVEMNAKPTTLWNSVGEITGSDPSQSVILGGHRDAWVYGVTDDGSGIASLLEVARGLGALHRQGWTPTRSIRIVGFDAEEIGELGSHAYVRMHHDELQRGCVAYINLDEVATGTRFNASATAAVSSAVADAALRVDGLANVKVRTPGGGSDFEPFIYDIGAPVISVGFSGPLGTYHSSYDDFAYAANVADPGFVHHRKIAQTAGAMALQLADSAAIPYTLLPYGTVLTAGATATGAAAQLAHVQFDASSLNAAIARFQTAARAFDAAHAAKDNATLLRVVHHLDALAYASNGYAAVPFPALAAAIASGRQQAVDGAIRQTVSSIDAASALLKD